MRRPTRFHDADHVCDVQEARCVRGDSSCLVSVFFATHERHRDLILARLRRPCVCIERETLHVSSFESAAGQVVLRVRSSHFGATVLYVPATPGTFGRCASKSRHQGSTVRTTHCPSRTRFVDQQHTACDMRLITAWTSMLASALRNFWWCRALSAGFNSQPRDVNSLSYVARQRKRIHAAFYYKKNPLGALRTVSSCKWSRILSSILVLFSVCNACKVPSMIPSCTIEKTVCL